MLACQKDWDASKPMIATIQTKLGIGVRKIRLKPLSKEQMKRKKAKVSKLHLVM